MITTTHATHATSATHAPARVTSRPSLPLGPLTAALVGTVTAVAFGADPASANSVAALENCVVSPAADDLAFDVAVLGTVRVVAGHVQVLHDVRCPDRQVEQRWIVESPSPLITPAPGNADPVDAGAWAASPPDYLEHQSNPVDRTTPLGACTLTPTADSIPLAEPLLDTYRMRNGVAEILHDVRCSDGRASTVWIAADVI